MPAAPGELDAVKALLAEAGLPVDDVGRVFPRGFVVVREGSVPVAAAGLEVHGASGLLRSVVVSPGRRARGLGRRLIESRVDAARAQGLEAVYLLTTSAAAYFEALGFERVARADVPEALARSTEFTSVCPASATCLVCRVATAV